LFTSELPRRKTNHSLLRFDGRTIRVDKASERTGGGGGGGFGGQRGMSY
jgi:hypothetical protein